MAGCITASLSLLGVSCAIGCGGHRLLAPRTMARPDRVLKNVLKRPYGIRWIPWALGLSYKDLLEGIPGTGTRRDGWSGTTLRTTLDGVVMIKFHTLCLRVAVFATLLCLGVILPINLTAPCDPQVVGPQVCHNLTSLEDFEKTTLANIPAMDFSEGTETAQHASSVGQVDFDYVVQSLKDYFSTAPGVTSRLFGVVIVAWCIYIYACGMCLRWMIPSCRLFLFCPP